MSDYDASIRKGFQRATADCKKAATWRQLTDAFRGFKQPTEALLRCKPTRRLSDTMSPLECVPEIVSTIRQEYVEPHDDFRYLFSDMVTDYIKVTVAADQRRKQRAGGKGTTDTELSDLATIVYSLFYGVGLPNEAEGMSLLFSNLEEMKNHIDPADNDVLKEGTASQKRHLVQSTCLALFSSKYHRTIFSALWSSYLLLPQDGSLTLHFLSSLADVVLPHLTNPLIVSDYAASAFAFGGLVSVMALDTIFVLMVKHNFEYPKLYDQLYSLLSPQSLCVLRYRERLFKLLDVALASPMIPAYITAAFIKRLARIALVAPLPTLYFVLPFIRKLLQRHPNTLSLIHQSAEDVEERRVAAEASAAKHRKLREERKKNKKGGARKRQRDGDDEDDDGDSDSSSGSVMPPNEDPFDPDETALEECAAIDSSLYELTVLREHFFPAVSLMAQAFGQPGEDTKPLQNSKGYARLFTREVTKEIHGRATLSYTAPTVKSLKEARGVKDLFCFAQHK